MRIIQEIAFKAVAGKNTRGPVTGTEFPTNNPIYVAAQHKASDSSEWKGFFGTNTSTVKYSVKSGESSWTSNPTYYYPMNGKMDFFAFYMEEKTPTFNFTYENTGDDKGRMSGVTVDATGMMPSGSTDMMYAYRPDVTDFTGTQSLKFKHVMTWITASMKGGNDDFLVKEIRISEAYAFGKFTIPIKTVVDNTTDPVTVARVAAEPNEIEWNFAESSKGWRRLFESTAAKAISTVTDWGKGVVIPPQAQSGIVVIYQSKATGNSFTQTIDLSDQEPWQAAKHYHYEIEVSLNSMDFTCTIEDADVYETMPNTPLTLE